MKLSQPCAPRHREHHPPARSLCRSFAHGPRKLTPTPPRACRVASGCRHKWRRGEMSAGMNLITNSSDERVSSMAGAWDEHSLSLRPDANARKGQHDVAIDISGFSGAACRSHAVDESTSTRNRAPQAGSSNGAWWHGESDQDVRSVERAECSGTIFPRPSWRGATRRSRGGGQKCHVNNVSMIWRSPAINITTVFLLVAIAALWLPGTAASAVDVCGNGRIVRDAGTSSQKSLSGEFMF